MHVKIITVGIYTRRNQVGIHSKKKQQGNDKVIWNYRGFWTYQDLFAAEESLAVWLCCCL